MSRLITLFLYSYIIVVSQFLFFFATLTDDGDTGPLLSLSLFSPRLETSTRMFSVSSLEMSPLASSNWRWCLSVDRSFILTLSMPKKEPGSYKLVY